jgi:hypothetical protein
MSRAQTIERPTVMSRALRRLQLKYGYGFRGDDIPMYGISLDRPVSEIATSHLGYHTYLNEVRPTFNDASQLVLTDNKWVFYKLAASHGLPIPDTLGLYEPHVGVRWDGAPWTRPEDVAADVLDAGHSSVVVKPAGGKKARHVYILDEIDPATGSAVLRTGERTSVRQVLDGLDVRPELTGHDYPGYVVQAAVAPHRDLRELAPGSSTTRIVTLLTSSGRVEVLGAVQTLARAGAMVDAWSVGAIACGIDPASGRLGEGVLRPEFGSRRMDTHPDTGQEFVGVRLPGWQEAVDVAARGARMLPALRTIGWDVLISDAGPVVLEANPNWGLHKIQTHAGGLLRQPTFRTELEAADVDLPSGRFDWRHISKDVLRLLGRKA